MFGMQAQAQGDCCFSLSNPSGDTLHGIANLPGGDLPLSHTMQPLTWHNTDTYNLVFSNANCLGIDYATGKVSIELELWLDGENVLDGQHNLSRYCDITMQTTYNELNWVGAPMIGTNYPDVFEYPGAVKQFTGTYNISNVNFDYFFFNFLVNSQTKVMITWNRVYRDVMLVAKIRERINGTNNEFYWNEQQTLNLGGHMSQKGAILATDTLRTNSYTESSETIKDCESVVKGMPAYSMDSTGTYVIAYVDTACGYRIDSIVTYDFELYVHPTTPTLSDSTYRYCQKGDATPIVLPAEPNDTLANNDVVPYWYFAAEDSFYYAPSFTPKTDTTAGVYEYYVKRHDNTTGCESAIDTFQVTILANPADPHVTDTLVENCVGEAVITLTYAAPAGQQVLWGTSSDNITSTTAPKTDTTVANTIIYYLKLQDTTTTNNCVSEGYDSIKVEVYDNPTVAITLTEGNDTLCFGSKVSLSATTGLTTYQWQKDDVDVTDSTNTTFSYINNVTDTTTFEFAVVVTEKHVVKSCTAKDSINVLAYPEIAAPVAAFTDTLVCGSKEVTLVVTPGTFGSTANWYASDTTTLLKEDATQYTATFDKTDTLFVSSLNDFGCETPKDQWVRIIVTVDTIPAITLTNDTNVCAGSDLILHSTVVSSYAPLTYAWTGTGLVAPLNEDSVTFNYVTAHTSTYTDTLTVTDAHNCSNFATVKVTVDSLPIIVLANDVTIKNSEYCVGQNGKITFNTEYVKYSIDNGLNWRNHPENVFDTLAAGNYNLKVENGKGCINNPATIATVIKDTVNPTLTITDSANTRCLAVFNGKLMVSVAPAAADGLHAYKYQLNDGAAKLDSVFAELEDGNTYKITVTDTITGCKTDSLNQKVTNGKIIPVPHLSSTNNTHCEAPYDGIVNIDSVTPLTGAYHYKLASYVPDTTAYTTDTFFTKLHDGFYSVIVEDTLSACIGSDTITVNYSGVKPTATIVGPDYICADDTNTVFSVNITEPNVRFNYWSYTGPVPDSTINTLKYKQSFKLKNYNTGMPFPPSTNIFKANIEDTITHCTNIISDTIRIIAVNIELYSNPVTDEINRVCEYDTVKVYSRLITPNDSIVTYYWFNGNDVHTVAPGVYDTVLVVPTNTASYVSLQAIDKYGCIGKMDKTINVWELPKITVTGDTAYCYNTQTDIIAVVNTVNPTPTIQWYRNDTLKSETIALYANMPLQTVNTNFNATVKVTDSEGCKNEKTIEIVKVDLPGAPVFDYDSLYFCNAEDIVVNVSQATPTTGSLVWNTNNPNVVKTEGVYAAHYEVSAQSSTCKSANDSVTVFAPGKPTFNITLRYNEESTPSTSKTRCYDANPADTVKVTVTTTTTPIGTMTYTYELNGHNSLSDMVITRTTPGTYNDTIKIKAEQSFPNGGPCNWDTTVYYTMTINPLPVAPSNFPSAYNSTNDSVIFYCQGSTANYTFTPQTGFTYTYSSGSIPTTAGSYHLIVTNVATACVDSFPYKIVEVPAPDVTVAHTANEKNCGDATVNDTIIATITNTIDASYTRFFVWNPGDSVAKINNVDTLFHLFTATDTMVTVKTGIYAANGEYIATCYKTPNYDTVKVLFQELPGMPKLDPAYTYYVDSAHAAYCASEHGTFSLTAANFLPIANATISIVGYTTVDTAGVYKVVANNTAAPNCPGDTLTLVVKEKRTPAEPTNIGTSGYNYNVYFCDGNTPMYEFAKANEKDTFMYSADGTNFVYNKPDTAGDYTLRVKDLVDTCYLDINFHIVKVANPDYTIAVNPVANWKNDTICQTSATYNQTFTLNITPNYTATTGVTSDTTIVWNGVSTDLITNTYNFTVANDTILYVAFDEFDTIGNVGYGVNCPFAGFKDTIRLTYFATPAVPYYSGDTTFCAGDTLTVKESDFNLVTSTHPVELASTPALPVSFIAAGGSVDVWAQYPSMPSCQSTHNLIVVTRYDLPTVVIAPHDTTICKGDTAVLMATGATTYEWSTGSTNAYTLAIDSIKYSVIGTNTTTGCKNYDTVKVSYHSLFTVEMAGDTAVCVSTPVTISAQVAGTGSYTFHWFKDDIYSSVDYGTSTVNPSTLDVTPDSSIKVNDDVVPSLWRVEVTDNGTGCVNKASENVVKVSSFTGARIEFRAIGGSESIRYMEVSSSLQSGFEMYIYDNAGCPCNKDEKVFIDYEISKNGVPMNNVELAEVMDALSGSNNTSYNFDLTVAASAIHTADFSQAYNTSYDHIPNYNNPSVTNSPEDLDWLYMHFILGLDNGSGHDGRKITVNTGMWKPGSKGVYKFTYAVMKADPSCPKMNYSFYEGMTVMGGGMAQAYTHTKDTILYDYFLIYVDSTYTGSSSDFGAPSVVTTAPEETTVEEKAIDMRVYPNPASNNVNVVLEGISGQTMITVHDMSGKAITSMRVDVDNDGQIVNLPVDSFSQGIYFIKAVNGKAVMTKKLIIAR